MPSIPSSSQIYRCQDCPSQFTNKYSLDDHWDYTHNFACYGGSCKGCYFDSLKSLAGHLASRKHRAKRNNQGYKCKICKIRFKEEIFLEIHNDACHPANHYQCCDCSEEFESEEELENHLNTTVHSAREILTTTTCEICNKDFKREEDLENHMNSSIHKNLPSAECPECKKSFRLLSILAHHLEGGKCKSGINKRIIDSTIVKFDTENIITIPGRMPVLEQKLIGDLSSSEDNDYLLVSASDGVLTPESEDGGVSLSFSTPRGSFGSFEGDSSGLITPKSRETGDNFDVWSQDGSEMMLVNHSLGNRFDSDDESHEEEYLCKIDSCERRFGSKKALQSHLLSVAHAPKIYKCPVSILSHFPKRKHRSREFTTLSGLTQHLESEACRGGMDGYIMAVKFLAGKLKELGYEKTLIKMN